MKRLIFLLIFAGLVGGGYIYYQQDIKQEQATVLKLYGNVDIRDVALGFRVSGRLSELEVDEGDVVHKGDVLAKLDAKPYEDELALATATVAQANAVLVNAQKLYKRYDKLVSSGAVSQSKYDEAISNRDNAEANYQVATAQRELAKIDLEDTVLVAPNDGIILSRVREEGAIVASGATVYSMVLHRPVDIRSYIDEVNLGTIAIGQKVEVSIDAGAVYEGKITFISPQAEFTPKSVQTEKLRSDLVYRVRVHILHPDEKLKQGMPVTVRIATQGS